jgi:hypothetical protein
MADSWIQFRKEPPVLRVESSRISVLLFKSENRILIKLTSSSESSWLYLFLPWEMRLLLSVRDPMTESVRFTLLLHFSITAR